MRYQETHGKPDSAAIALPRPVSLFDRAEEFSILRRSVIENRHSMLIFGEEGSGKSLLLQRLASINKECLYVPHCTSPTDLLTGIITSMRNAGIAYRKTELKMSHTGLRNLKGVIQRALEERNWILLVDHVQSPSAALAHLVKELNYYDRTPIAFAGRSEHMEDIGNFRTFCTDRSASLEVKPWPHAVALKFARQQAALFGLTANNLEETVSAITEMSKGHPGPILKMLRMAKDAAYQRDGQIKFHIVYLDYRLRGTGTPSSNVKPNAEQ